MNYDSSPEGLKFREAIASTLDVAPEEVRLEARFIDDLNADSLAQVEIILALEDAFNITVPDEEVENFRVVKEAWDYLEKRLVNV